MKNSMLWQLLRALSSPEHKALVQWLTSPSHNRRTEPLVLYRYLAECLALKKTPEQSEAIAYIQTHQLSIPDTEKRGRPAKTTNSHRPSDQKAATQFRLEMRHLLELCENFLVFGKYHSDPVSFQIKLSEVYREKGLDKHFQTCIQDARQLNNKQPYRDSSYFDGQAAISFEWYQYAGNLRKTEQLQLQELSVQTDTAYIARKLKHACLALAYQTVYRSDYDAGLLPSVIAYVRHRDELFEIPAVALYYYCYLLFTEPEADTYFNNFKTMLLGRQQELPTEEQRILHLLGINYCIFKINQLDKKYCREALDLYQSGLENKLLIEHGVLSHMAFNNIVSIALKIDETQWAGRFIDQYEQFLERKLRASTAVMNRARILHEQKKYLAALEQLTQFDTRDQANNLLARSLQLKIYYEMSDYDALDLHLQSMQVFIRRQRVIGYHKTNYLNIIKYTRKLMTYNPNDKAEKASLRQKIESEERLTEKEWMLEMLR